MELLQWIIELIELEKVEKVQLLIYYVCWTSVFYFFV